MDQHQIRRIVICAFVATVGACGGHSDDDNETSSGTPNGQPTQPAAQTETVLAKAQGNFAPGAQLIVELPGYATLVVPGDAFAGPRRIEVAAIVSQETSTAWTDTSAMFQPSAVSEHEIRITTGDASPSDQMTSDIALVLVAPESFLANIPQASDVRAFAQISQVDEATVENIDAFEYLGSSRVDGERTVTMALAAFTFTDQRPITAKSFAAIVKLASVPPLPPEASTVGESQISVHQGLTGILRRCQPVGLGSPLDQQLEVNKDRYVHLDKKPHPITGEPKPHDGTDLKAADGDVVRAAMSGTIIEARKQVKSNGTGYGWTIVVANGIHTTRYAHLQEGSLRFQVGQSVSEGQVLAAADHSGGVTAPHLHFEYAVCGIKQEPLRHIRGPFVGIYEGTYGSTLENGGVNGELEFEGWANNRVVVTTPEEGTGTVDKDGSASFAALNPPGPSGSFTGIFIGTLGQTAAGSWSGTANGATSAHGSWSAARVYTPAATP
jgi:murein DD-endopeptidase MepM/ murein hydrolase activator NlpD